MPGNFFHSGKKKMSWGKSERSRGISKRKQLATYYRDEMPKEGTEDREREGQRPSALKSNINYEQ